jgi:hypothetical protein
MYTILVNDDNTLHASVRTRIMQSTKNIDSLHFLVKPMFNDIDMTEATVVLTYILPISKERKTLTLTKSEELYKERLEYKILLNEDFTTEVGDIQMYLTFMIGDDIIRKTNSATITINKVEETIIDPDEPSTISNVDDLYFDKNTNQIYLTAGGMAVGGSISVSDLSNAIVDTTNEGLVNVVTD